MLIRLLLTFIFIHCSIAAKTIIDILSEDKRFETLLNHIQHFELVTFVNKLESGTLFAPDNDAFKRYKPDVDRSTLLYHLIKKGILVNDFYDGQIKETLYSRPGYLGPDTNNAGQRVKFTKGKDKVFINNAKIISEDIQVNNETNILVVDRVLEPPKLLGDTLGQVAETGTFNLMNSTDIIQILQSTKPFTIFLTTSTNLLDKFNSIESTYLTSTYGKDDLSTFFKYSVIDKAIFIDEFKSGKTTYKSLSGDSLVLATDKNKQITINDIPIKKSDIIAANGVIHQIDETFKPDVIKFNARKYMHGLNVSYMVDLIDKYQSSIYIDQHQFNYTFLIPPYDLINDTLISKSWLRYHIINGSWPQENLIDNMLLKSEFKSSDLAGYPQRLPVYIEKEDIFSEAAGKSVQFDKSRATGDYVNIHDDIIYQISEPLTLPGDILGKLVLDLDLSTFIATLYVSEVVDELKNTQGLTLFVPTNQAFQNLGLVAKYLVHPSAKSQLQTVLRYHVAQSLLYYQDMKTTVHEVSTLANSTLRISQNESGSIIVSRPEGSTNAGIVSHTDTLVSNGVIHKISEVQIPTSVEITNQNLLVGIESKIMTQILTKANLLDVIDNENIVVLAPTDKAFAHVDLEVLLNDPYQLERVAKLHIIPSAWQDRWIEDIRHDKTEYPTLLSSDDKVTIRENEKGELSVIVKNGGDNDQAHVVGLGRVSAGGGVISIDAVLIPIRRGFFGLPFMWSVVVTLVIIIITGGILSLVGFFTYKIYNRRRLGYRPIY